MVLLMTHEAESILFGEGFHLRHHHRVLPYSAQPCQIRVIDNADRRRMLPKQQSLMQEALHPEAVEHPIEAQVPSFGIPQVKQAGDQQGTGAAQTNRIARGVVLHLGARFIRHPFAAGLLASPQAQLAQQACQRGVLNLDAFVFHQFLVHPLRVAVTFLVESLQQIRIYLDLVFARADRYLALLLDDDLHRVGADPELTRDLVALHPLLVEEKHRLAFVHIDHAVSSSPGKMLAPGSRFRPSVDAPARKTLASSTAGLRSFPSPAVYTYARSPDPSAARVQTRWSHPGPRARAETSPKPGPRVLDESSPETMWARENIHAPIVQSRAR